LIECPRYLFPFARRIIADITSEGGYPPFLLDPIDFAGVYAARKAEAAVRWSGTRKDSSSPLGEVAEGPEGSARPRRTLSQLSLTAPQR
jgi:hypothetical protein